VKLNLIQVFQFDGTNFYICGSFESPSTFKPKEIIPLHQGFTFIDKNLCIFSIQALIPKSLIKILMQNYQVEI
jgi:hypothetical protein